MGNHPRRAVVLAVIAYQHEAPASDYSLHKLVAIRSAKPAHTSTKRQRVISHPAS
ncbi:hypothetical protein CA51_07550 [Rosistilla oblonga]|nr:hypothetical protein CA51_07550 [Rosistilla oblonga]